MEPDDLGPQVERFTTDALYTLETPAACPACKELIYTVGVVRLLRTKVNFTSTLPRRGYLAVCPECHTIIPAELGGLL